MAPALVRSLLDAPRTAAPGRDRGATAGREAGEPGGRDERGPARGDGGGGPVRPERRGGTRDARERIREAAERLFAERGFEATSVRDVTAEAGCNLAAVSYHFGGKDELYREVCRGRLRRLRDARAQAATAAAAKGAASFRSAGGDAGPAAGGTRGPGAPGAGRPRALGRSAEPAEAVEARLRTILHAYARGFLQPFEDPEDGGVLLRIWLREAIDPRLPQGELREAIAGPAQEELAETLRQAVEGLSERNALAAASSFTGQLVHHVKLGRLLSREPRLEGELGAPRALEPLVRFAAAGVRALAARASPRKRRSGARADRKAPRGKTARRR